MKYLYGLHSNWLILPILKQGWHIVLNTNSRFLNLGYIIKFATALGWFNTVLIT